MFQGPWYITATAARTYATLMGGDLGEASLAQARADLIAIAQVSHFVRVLQNGSELWRANPEWYRIGLVVRGPRQGEGETAPALVKVLSPHRGWVHPQPQSAARGEP